MKKIVLKCSIVFILVLIGIIAIIPSNKSYENTPWMKDLQDDFKIVDLSIPGTHNSGSPYNFFEFLGKCQELTIENQLKIGVRFFDIRLQNRNDELYIVHDMMDQKQKFEEMIEVVNKYMEENPSEFLIISIKQDADPINQTKSFEELTINALNSLNNLNTSNSLPNTLGEARGNVYILNRFTSSDFGIPAFNNWKDSTSFMLDSLYVQDNYSVKTVEEKINDIKEAFKFQEENDIVTVNFASCYLKDLVFPYHYALTPTLDINDWLNDYVQTLDSTGILLVDFATEELVENIYMRNFK